MQRENRYIILKLKDIAQALTATEINALNLIETKVNRARYNRGKNPLKCVVVESDWPEYQATLNSLE